MLKETVITRLVKPEDLQHHGTLFAGRMAEWLVETCFIAACRFIEKPEDVVCVQVHGITFDRPVHNGDLLEIRARIALAGTASITVHGQAFAGDDSTPSVTGMATFVTVDKNGKPYRHGRTLPEEYIAQNRQIHETALKVRREDRVDDR